MGDRSARTRLQVFGSLLIEAADDFGEAAVKLDPVVRCIERITAALSGARRAEEATLGLPAPKEKKRIEGPKAGVRKGNFDRVLDDEIPFEIFCRRTLLHSGGGLMAQCIFCGSATEITKEHVWADWLKAHIPK